MRLPEEEISQLREGSQCEALELHEGQLGSGVHLKQHPREEPESRVVELGEADEVPKQ